MRVQPLKVPIADYARILGQRAGEFERRLAQLPKTGVADVRLNRARLLGQLSRHQEAIHEMLPVVTTGTPLQTLSPMKNNLLIDVRSVIG